MPFFVCIVPVCPVRAEAAHRSEQTTQLLFGEVCELLETSKDFSRVRIVYDDYEGWCQTNQLAEVGSELPNGLPNVIAADWVNKVEVNNQPMNIPFGSSLALLPDGNNTFGKFNVAYKGSVIHSNDTFYNEENIRRLSSMFSNTAYLWGGRSVFGVDCSGFTQLVYKCMGIHLMRDAYQQATQGEVIGFLQEVKCGDLAFF